MSAMHDVESGLPHLQRGENRVGAQTVWYITIATLPHPNLDILKTSCASRGASLLVLGEGDGRVQSKTRGYGLKLFYVAQFVSSLLKSGRGADLVLFTDAYDTLLSAPLDAVVDTYKSFGADVVFSGEIPLFLNCVLNPLYSWVARRRSLPRGEFPHLNSGVMVGTATALDFFYRTRGYNNSNDDQVWWIRAYLTGKSDPGTPTIEIDRHGRLAISALGIIDRVAFDTESGRFYDKKTGVRTCILHLDGRSLKALVPKYAKFSLGLTGICSKTG